MAFVDPVCVGEEESESNMEMGPMSSDIQRLSDAWGLTVDVSRVVADLGAATPINLGNGRSEMLPAWLSLRGEKGMDRNEIATSSLDSLMLPFAGWVSGTPVEGLNMNTLVFASTQAVSVSAMQASSAPDRSIRDGVPASGAALVVRISGRFPTAFPDGPPKSKAGEDGETEADAGEWLKTAEKDGVVILATDADLLVDRFMAQTLRFFGQTVHQPINDNLNFVLNVAEQLSGNPALIGLRSRGRYNRPFERVMAMEQAAQTRWQEEEANLQQKLVETQQRLSELQTAKSDDQQLVLSAAQKAEIERFRQERFETQRQLTEVRRNLRQNIERLGLALKVGNMAAVPLLVGVFGIVHGLKRRKRAGA